MTAATAVAKLSACVPNGKIAELRGPGVEWVDTNDGTTTISPIVDDAAVRVRLVLQRDQQDATPIDCRRVVTLIGTRDGCKVHLRHKRISPVHAAVINNGFDVYAVDLVTKAGTFLNGLRMEHEQIHDGDLLDVKPFLFRVDVETPTRGAGADVHPILEPTPQAIALEHLTTGRILQSNREVCVIGRRNGCDIVLGDKQVSRAHCLLFNYFGHPTVYDLLSHNRTLINGRPIVYQALRNNDILTVGDTKFRVRLLESKVGKGSSKDREDGQDDTNPAARAHPPDDMIDIEATEGSQRWRIVDKYEKTERKP